MLPLLLPLVTNLAPPLASWLFGPKAERTAAAVSAAVQETTGADPSTADGAAAVQSILASKPELAIQLQTDLLRIHATMQAEADQAAAAARADDLARLQASLTDMAGARAQSLALANARSPLAYGPAIVSGIVLAVFALVSTLALTHQLPTDNQTLITGLVTSLQTMVAGVVSYWCGSSAGSARKDVTLAHLALSGTDASADK